MLKEFNDPAEYHSSPKFTRRDVAVTYANLHYKYAIEYKTSDLVRPFDFRMGCVILKNTFRMVLASTGNLQLADKTTTYAMIYFTEFINQLLSNKKNHAFQCFRAINALDVAVDEDGASRTNETDKDNDAWGRVRRRISSPRSVTTCSRPHDQITYLEIQQFVYSKTVASVVREHSVDTHTPEMKRILTECDVLFGIGDLFVSLVSSTDRVTVIESPVVAPTVVNPSPMNFEVIQKTIFKTITIFENERDLYTLSTVQLQTLYTFLTYVVDQSKTKNDASDRFDLFVIYIKLYPRILLNFNPTMTPADAMRRVNNPNFLYYIHSLSPYAFVRWFVSL